MILQIGATDIDINRAWDIDPYNGLAYGGLIVLLICTTVFLGFAFWKYIEKTDAIIRDKDLQIRELADNGNKALDVLISKITEIKESHINSKEVILLVLNDIKDKVNQKLFNH